MATNRGLKVQAKRGLSQLGRGRTAKSGDFGFEPPVKSPLNKSTFLTSLWNMKLMEARDEFFHCFLHERYSEPIAPKEILTANASVGM